jgi:hypothetical protein
MKSFKQIVCFAVVLLITMLFALQAAAELPRTREIRDKFMWGDPDYPLTKKRSADIPWLVIGPRDTDQAGNPQAQTWYVLTALRITAGVYTCVRGRLPENRKDEVGHERRLGGQGR